MSEVVILSPHFDDAVLNCWHAVANATVINIFAGVPPVGTSRIWDRLCGEADSHKMVQLRKQENEIAVAMSGSIRPQIYLDFLDNQYRKSNPTTDELLESILAKSPKKCSFLVPLAKSRVYRHPDHVLTRKVGIELLRRGYKVGFYPDAPYTSLPRKSTASFEKRTRASTKKSLGQDVNMRIYKMTADQLKSKDAAMHAYKTQYKMTNLESFGGLKRIARRGYEVIIEPIDVVR